MAYSPLQGWLQMTSANEQVRSRRFHSDVECGKRRVARHYQRAQEKGVTVVSELTGPMPYADVHGTKGLTCASAGRDPSALGASTVTAQNRDVSGAKHPPVFRASVSDGRTFRVRVGRT